MSWDGKLNSMLDLQDGWDSHGGEAPAKEAIEKARAYLASVPQVPKRVSPSAMGGVAITFKDDRKKLFVEFYNTGKVYALLVLPGGMDVFPVDMESFKKFVEDFE